LLPFLDFDPATRGSFRSMRTDGANWFALLLMVALVSCGAGRSADAQWARWLASILRSMWGHVRTSHPFRTRGNWCSFIASYQRDVPKSCESNGSAGGHG
jgi:hypothetical protein